MSTTTTYKPRKATFTVEIVKGQRHFTAVNKRAKTVCKKLGKRTKTTLTLQELRSTINKGSYKFFAYTPDGKLKKIVV
jgi:hypothetical protein